MTDPSSANETISVREIEHGSAAWSDAVELRNRVLRRPLGLELTREELHAQHSCFHLAACDSGGHILGTILLCPLDGGHIQMRQVAVAPEAQQQGVGRVMVRAAEALARDRNFDTMVLDARDTAIGFYQRLGYTTVGDLFDEHTIPHIRMVKSLR